jgi:1,5-anhydro-D-fructose reductase (1,5-anhydro-D-mannitol-forming)
MDTLRFGIIGLGFMGRTHFARLRQHPHARVVALCDSDERRRSGQWNDKVGNLDDVLADDAATTLDDIAPYSTIADLVADPDVDAVVVALPTRLHADATVAALEAGKHVLCEKPMGLRVGDCDRMIAATESAGRTLMVAQCIRFWPQYELIERMVRAGEIGRVRYANLRRLGSRPTYSSDNWLMDAASSGGALLDLHVHDLDFVQHLLGVPDAIHAHGVIGQPDIIDLVTATWRYADGCYACIEGGWAFTPPWPFEMAITVHGDRGTLEWALSRGPAIRHYNGSDNVREITCEGDAYGREDDYFIECVRTGQPVDRCTPQSTRTSIALAWLERRAIETGRVVPISGRLKAAWER